MRCVVQFVYGRNKLFKWSLWFFSHSFIPSHVNLVSPKTSGVQFPLALAPPCGPFVVLHVELQGVVSGAGTLLHTNSCWVSQLSKQKGRHGDPKIQHIDHLIVKSWILLTRDSCYIVHNSVLSVFNLQLELRIIFIISYTASCSPY